MRPILSTITAMALMASAAASSDDVSTLPSFADLDANSDARVDQREFEAFGEALRDRMRGGSRRGLGPPRGGGVDSRGRMARLFERADADGDALLDENEYADLLETVQSRLANRRQSAAPKDRD